MPNSESTQPSQLDRVIDTWGGVHDTMLRALVEALGEDRVKEVLYTPLFNLGAEAAAGAQPTAPAMGRVIMAFEANWHIEGRILEESDERFVREVTYCPWAHFHPLGCETLAWWMEGFCHGMNPAFEYRLEKLIPRGAATCVWSITRV